MGGNCAVTGGNSVTEACLPVISLLDHPSSLCTQQSS